MNCPKCNSAIELRQIVFGRVGKIEMLACECEAMRIALKYENTGTADNKRKVFTEDL